MTLRHAALAAVLLLAACSENADTGRRQLAVVPDAQLAQMADQSWAQMRQTAAVSAGVSLARYKTFAFGISAAYAGLAGGLLALATTGVIPGASTIAVAAWGAIAALVGAIAADRERE